MTHTRAEYDHLDALLRDWGEWQEQHCEDVVLPSESAFCMIVSDQPPGSRILCADMSEAVWTLNCAILMMRKPYRMILFVWYAVQLKDTGGYWNVGEKAQLLGCTVNALRKRIARARRVLLAKYYKLLETKALQKRLARC